jgi:non-canonical (house-cleaning) NTP pyrophosphatase
VLGVGIESGIMTVEVDHVVKWFNFTSCAIYNGKKSAIGTGPSFELPTLVIGIL